MTLLFSTTATSPTQVTNYYIGAAHDECNRQRCVTFLYFYTILAATIRIKAAQMGKILVFRDLLMFHKNSLESLVQSLCKTDKQRFKHIESLISLKFSNTDFKLLVCNSVFSYDYFDWFEKLNESSLPHRKAFYSTLRKEKCLLEDFTTRNACEKLSDVTLSKTNLSSTWLSTSAN